MFFKVILTILAILAVAFILMVILALAKKKSSVYGNEPEQRNKLKGKKVVFVENENEPENADGVRGHLEAVGESAHQAGVYEKYIKRGLDVILSFGGLVILSPVFLILAVAIYIDDPGPILFTQKRTGKNKQYFKLHKFRSMKMSTPHDKPTHMLENPEQYITRVGKFLRAHSLDELPQIWDIFIGNMSVIGPRPGLWNQDLLTAERDKYGANDVKPGLTGWAQINGRDELEIPDKAKLDGEYVEKLSFGFDVKCFLGSVGVFGGDDSVVEGGTGEIKKDHEEENRVSVEERKHTYSVLMSVYKNDDPDFLKIALESIYDKQIVKPDEIVVVYDGPLNEKLYAVLDTFKVGKEAVVKYYPQEVNRGLGEALRIGSEYCTCDYILRMDSDDISDEHRFERQILYVENHPEIDVLGTDIAEFNQTPNEDMRVRSCPEKHEDIVNMGKRRNPMNHVTVCMKKSALEKCGGYKTLLLLEDYYLWLNMIAAGCKLANIHESLVYVRVGNGFDSKRGSQERIDGWKVLQDFMLEHKMITKKDAMMNMIYINAFVKTPSWLKKILYSKLLRK
ncbi:sugar transferase [Sporofaciens sp. SGI.106]|uniref:sugar transferase n=1 Tax=Sporofaciens sp. SGI.106 TaxID=3420568 RepID=UPI003D05A2A4